MTSDQTTKLKGLATEFGAACAHVARSLGTKDAEDAEEAVAESRAARDALHAAIDAIANQPATFPAARANDDIDVGDFDYPTTYKELATLPAEKLWNRYVCDRPWPDAKQAFLVARAIPFVVQHTVPAAPAAISREALRAALKAAELGHGSYHQNYDGNRLGHAIEDLLNPSTKEL